MQTTTNLHQRVESAKRVALHFVELIWVARRWAIPQVLCAPRQRSVPLGNVLISKHDVHALLAWKYMYVHLLTAFLHKVPYPCA